MDYKSLKSGTDIRGVAIATPGQEATLTPAIVECLGQAFALLTAKRAKCEPGGLHLAVGRDSRLSGESLAQALMRGMAATGAHILDCGLCTTPAMFLSTLPEMLGCHGAVMITASHHPWTRNGCKFFWPTGGLDGGDIDTLIALAQQAPALSPASSESWEQVDFLSQYTAFLRQVFQAALPGDLPLSGQHIVVDAGNGAGGFYADLLSSLGADTSGSQFLDPDGRFPGHTPNPEDPGAMASLGDAVRRAGADLGVIFDADCDRAAIVGGDGSPINRDRLVALTAAMVLRESPGATLVTDSVTSLGLTRFIQSLGGRHCRFRRGYRNVIDEAIRLNNEGVDCPLAMETSGHAALRENHFLDDGMYLATRLILFLTQCGLRGETVTSLLLPLREPTESREIRLAIGDADFRAVGQSVLQALESAANDRPDCHLAPDSREGVRVLFGPSAEGADGFVMLRLSVHDPVLPLNAETYRAGTLADMLRAVYDALHTLPGVDWSPLAQEAGR